MKRLAAGLVVLVLAVTICRGEESAEREWTTTQGSKVKASFVRLDGEKVVLKKAEGQLLSVNVKTLVEEDQKLVAELGEKGASADESKPVIASKGLAAAQPAGGGLSDDEISKLATEWTNPKNGNKLVFTASIETQKLSGRDREKFVKSGKVPIRIIATLYETKIDKGKTLYMRESGTCHIRLTNSDGKAVLSETVSLDKMCPS